MWCHHFHARWHFLIRREKDEKAIRLYCDRDRIHYRRCRFIRNYERQLIYCNKFLKFHGFRLIFLNIAYILGIAMLGGKVAVSCNSQSALARLKSFSRLSVCKVCLLHVALKIGSRAMSAHEPCQVRKEAALSGLTHVPWGSLVRAGDKSNACVRQSKKGAWH